MQLEPDKVYLFDTTLQSEFGGLAAAPPVSCLSTSAFQHKLVFSKMPPLSALVAKEGVVASLLLKGEIQKREVLCVSLTVQNRYLADAGELGILKEVLEKCYGPHFAGGDNKHASMENPLFRQLLQAHNSRSSGLYS